MVGLEALGIDDVAEHRQSRIVEERIEKEPSAASTGTGDEKDDFFQRLAQGGKRAHIPSPEITPKIVNKNKYAPETYDSKADIWMVGNLLFTLLSDTLTPPFES